MEKIKINDVVNNEYNCFNLPELYNQQRYNIFTEFTLKHLSIINRLIYLNKRLDEHYKTWKALVCEPPINKSSDTNLLKSLLNHKKWQRKLINNHYEQEELIMHLRKAIDDCICLLSIATKKLFFDKDKNLHRPFESIGEFINQIDKFKAFKIHQDYLKTINDISNGFKHCVANNISFKLGKNEPCIFIYETKNSYYNEIGISLNDLIKGFNCFYQTFDSKIKNPSCLAKSN